MTSKQTLAQLIASSSQKKLLFLGKASLFTEDEIIRFLKKHDMTLTRYLEDDVAFVVEPLNLNPVEEDVSNDAYTARIPSFSLDEFEQYFSASIHEDELLMAIKLSNDQERVFRLLGNTHISETLFLKLLMMYQWHVEDEDNREDRDTIMYTLKRYIDIKPNESDLHYSYLTLRRLATEASNPKLLLALIGFQNFEFLIRGKERVSLRETIARNRNIDEEVIHKLISLRDSKVYIALACNPSVNLARLEILLNKDDSKINQALATNTNIDDNLFTKLLSKDETTIQLLLWYQAINTLRLAMIDAQLLEPNLFAIIGANEHLDEAVITDLLTRDNTLLISHLGANTTLSVKYLEELYAKNIQESFVALAGNSASPVVMLEILYNSYNEEAIHRALAANKSTPEKILRELYTKEDLEIYRSMASNPSIPLDILDMLKVDTRLQNELSTNPILIKGYETVLDYDKKAVQF